MSETKGTADPPVLRVGRIRIDGVTRWCYTTDDDTATVVSDDLTPQEALSPEHLLAAGQARTGVAVSRLQHLVPVDSRLVIGVRDNFPKSPPSPASQSPVPALFIKTPFALCAHGTDVPLPAHISSVVIEPELAVIIGRPARQVTPERAGDHIAGFACFNDLTAAALATPFDVSIAKGLPGFGPWGPWITLCHALPTTTRISGRVNGRPRSDGTISQMRFSPEALLSFVSHQIELEPGDVLAMGTPQPVSEARAGDVIDVEIDGLGAALTVTLGRQA